ncbi:MAG: type II toxin-antitoxin system Phd/YefM family antitoxin [Thiobacillaceae bacterium]
MKTVAIYEMKANLSHLLDQVEAGEEITVTRRGVPIARLVPDHPPVKADIAALIERTKFTRHKSTLEGLSLNDLIEEGRDWWPLWWTIQWSWAGISKARPPDTPIMCWIVFPVKSLMCQVCGCWRFPTFCVRPG